MKTTHKLSIPSRQLLNCEQTYEPATITGLVDSLHYQVRCWELANPTEAGKYPIFQALRSAVLRSNKEYRPTSSGTIYPAYVVSDACAILGMLTEAGEIMGGYVTHEQMMIRSGTAAFTMTPDGQQEFLNYINLNRDAGDFLRKAAEVEEFFPHTTQEERSKNVATMCATKNIAYLDLHLRAFVFRVNKMLHGKHVYTADQMKCVLAELLSYRFGPNVELESALAPTHAFVPGGQPTAEKMVHELQNSITFSAISEGPLRSLCASFRDIDSPSSSIVLSARHTRSALMIGGVARQPQSWFRLYDNALGVCADYDAFDQPTVEDLYACVGLCVLRAYDQLVMIHNPK